MIQLRRHGVREFGETAAERLVDELERVFALLRDNPFAGAAFSETLPGVRVFPKRGHRIFDRVDDRTIIIQRILHYSRDAARHVEP